MVRQGEGEKEHRVTLLDSPLISLPIALFSTSGCKRCSVWCHLPKAASVGMSPPSLECSGGQRNSGCWQGIP